MKKRLLATLICLTLCSVLCVNAFATGDIGIIGGADGETEILLSEDNILYGEDFFDDGSFYDDQFYTDGYTSDMAEIEELLEQFGEENVGILIATVIVIIISSMLFWPALIVLIVFAVLNSKKKKQIKELEKRNNGFAGIQYQPQSAFQPYAQPIAQPFVNTQPVAQPIINGEAVNTVENNEGGEA